MQTTTGEYSHRVGTRRVFFDSLSGLRFILAAWIALFHVGHMFDDHGLGAEPLLRAGASRVDIFFVLSGFVLAHVYWNRSNLKFNYLDFMVTRLARLYPVYLLGIVLLAAFIFAGKMIGKAPSSPYSLHDLGLSLILGQSFGLTDTNNWNFPAWAVSASMGGYLLFPLFLWLADKLKRAAWMFLALVIFGILGADLACRHFFNLPLNNAVTDWGALRGAMMILCGVAARVAYTQFLRGREGAFVTAAFGAIACLMTIVNQWGLPLIGFSASMFVIGLARLDHMDEGTFLGAPIMKRAGELSYAIFILHAPVYSITVEALSMLGISFEATLWTSLLLVAEIVIIAIPVTYWFEKPVYAWLKKTWNNRRSTELNLAQA